MGKINRREFIRTGIAGAVGLSVGAGLLTTGCLEGGVKVDRVALGNTGLTVSRIAMGTGTMGRNKSSHQTQLGTEAFVKLAHHAYDRGIRFYEMAEMYGSHPYVRQAMKTLPREKVTLLTKFWSHPEPSLQTESTQQILDRLRKEAGTDYFDIVLLHCIMHGNWDETHQKHIEGLAKAKQDGIVKAVGLSCHNWDAMVTAVDHPWVDVILARINPFQTLMDGTPEAVSELLGRARANGKGILGMKIFGEGQNVSDDERERSLKFAVTQSNIHCMTLGLESEAQMDDAIERVMRLARLG